MVFSRNMLSWSKIYFFRYFNKYFSSDPYSVKSREHSLIDMQDKEKKENYNEMDKENNKEI